MDFLADFQNVGILTHDHSNEPDWDNGDWNPGMFDAQIARLFLGLMRLVIRCALRMKIDPFIDIVPYNPLGFIV